MKFTVQVLTTGYRLDKEPPPRRRRDSPDVAEHTPVQEEAVFGHIPKGFWETPHRNKRDEGEKWERAGWLSRTKLEGRWERESGAVVSTFVGGIVHFFGQTGVGWRP